MTHNITDKSTIPDCKPKGNDTVGGGFQEKEQSPTVHYSTKT